MKASQLTAISLLLHVFTQIECETLITRYALDSKNSNALSSRYSSKHYWPWHAEIYYITDGSDLNYRCGGTVISPKSILTAANCVQIDANHISVSLYRQKSDSIGTIAQTYKVDKVIVHPDFEQTDYKNDIAIIKLSTNVFFNGYVPLWNSSNADLSEIVGKLGMVVGWEETETAESSYKLQELTVVDFLTCLKSSPSYFATVLSDTNFCAGHRSGPVLKPSFKGGSMTFVKDQIYYIRGIMSTCLDKVDRTTGQVTCDSQYAVFTDVAPFLPWIAKTVAENDK